MVIPATDNLPPSPVEEPHRLEASFVAYLWRGDKHDEIGHARTGADGHLLELIIGVPAGEIVEIRALSFAFHPGTMLCDARFEDPNVAKPSFTVHAAEGERIGTAFPHKDGKGHRLKCRVDLPDGSQILLRDTQNYLAAGARAPHRKRSFRPGVGPRA